ncbi:MAG: IMP cyclohydrolase [Halococcoides sp.]
MYVGRFVVVAPSLAAYRVSSRSFPNRRAREREGAVTVEPTPDAPETDNPYIAYNCLRTTDRGAVIGNGSHVDPIAEKLARGYPARDALVEALHALDFEKDDYDTPRIAGVVGDGSAVTDSFVGIVRRDALLVEAVDEPTLVATYERNRPESIDFGAESAADAAREVFDMAFEHPVAAAGLARTAGEFETGVVNE